MKILEFFNRINSLATFCLTLAGMFIAVKSCNISEDVKNDHRQLDYQQDQLKGQQSQLKILTDQYQKAGEIESRIDSTSKNISKQLEITEKQQEEQMKQALLTKRMYVTQLRNTAEQMFRLERENINFGDSLDAQIAFLKNMRSMIKDELNNFILLENDNLSHRWLNLYSLIGIRLTTLTTEINNPPITQTGEMSYGKKIRFTEDEMNEYKQQAFSSACINLESVIICTLRVLQKKYRQTDLLVP